MKQEYLARAIVVTLLVLVLALPVIGKTLWRLQNPTVLEMRARLPESGGWSPSTITVRSRQLLTLRFTSEDVVHGFAIGKLDQPEIEILPGEFVETTLILSTPGKYVFYCTRWCGPNHWRMRGVINVIGDGPTPTPEPTPLYLGLEIDLDAPHQAEVIPDRWSNLSAGQSYRTAYRLMRLSKPPTFLTAQHPCGCGSAQNRHCET